MQLAVVLLVALMATATVAAPTPVVLWHGMGDTATSIFSMDPLIKLIEKQLPGVYVRSIRIGNSTAEDELGGFFGDFNIQLETVCAQLAADSNLARGFNAVGFSQGGQFLRAYVQRCNKPQVHNLISMGGQHMGVADIPHCTATNSSLCELMAKVLSVGAYADGVRNYSIQAQYFRSPLDYNTYLQKNIFLADINNENAVKNPQYKANLITLNKLVLVQFLEDTMVVPRVSEWFGAFANGTESYTIPMEQQPIYTQDWIGIKTLNDNKKLDQIGCPGDHLQFTETWFVDNIIKPYLA